MPWEDLLPKRSCLKQHLLSSGLHSTQVHSFYGRAASGSFSGDLACEVRLLSSAHKQNEQRDKGSLCYVTSRVNGQRDTFLRLLFKYLIVVVKISKALVEKSQRDRPECVRGIEDQSYSLNVPSKTHLLKCDDQCNSTRAGVFKRCLTMMSLSPGVRQGAL